MIYKKISRLKKKIEKFIRHSFLSGILFRNKPVILTDAYGMRFILYPSAHEPLEKLLSRRYLVGEYQAISKIVKSGNIVIDVGSNIGTHTIYMSKLVGPNGKIYSFEPVPETSWQLKENLVLNRIGNVEVVTSALKDKDGMEMMNIFPNDFSAWNSFGLPETDESRPVDKIKVKATKLETFTNQKNIKHIDFLKIDAEGSEKDVFEGARSLLKAGAIGVLSFEISEIPLKGMNGNSKELFDILSSYGYKVYEYNAREKKFIGPIADSTSQCENYYTSKKDLKTI